MTQTKITRRDWLRGATASLVAISVVGISASEVLAAISDNAKSAIKKIIGDKKPTEGKITLDAPQIAENGNTVPLTISVDSPMTSADHVKALHIFADGNPNTEVSSFMFTPANGVANVSTRLRLAKTQNVVAVAEMSNGSLFQTQAAVKVTIGGCGG